MTIARRSGLLLAVVVGAVTWSPRLGAQDSTAQAAARAQDTASTPDRDYNTQRQATLNDIRTAEKKLSDLRAERIELESRVEAVAVKAAQQRANELLLSHQTTALRQLDSLLTSSQDNLLLQRDRFLALGEAVRRRADAELIVLIRVDSAQTLQRVDSLAVQVDSAPAAARHYSMASNDALAAGAVDEVYRSNVLPATHGVTLMLQLDGKPITKSANVDVPTGAVTYVQFAVRDGQLVLSTWTNRSGPP
jgi:hypothetical protein